VSLRSAVTVLDAAALLVPGIEGCFLRNLLNFMDKIRIFTSILTGRRVKVMFNEGKNLEKPILLFVLPFFSPVFMGGGCYGRFIFHICSKGRARPTAPG
jgi:hypothetical protein